MCADRGRATTDAVLPEPKAALRAGQLGSEDELTQALVAMEQGEGAIKLQERARHRR